MADDSAESPSVTGPGNTRSFEWHTTQCSIMKWRGTGKCNCSSIKVTNKIKRLLNEALNKRGE